MLVSLEIKNFLLIKKISINFIKGFNAFTGETGAGKSTIARLLVISAEQTFDLSTVFLSVNLKLQ